MLWQRIIFSKIYLSKKDNFLRDSIIYVWVFGWIQAFGLDLVLIQVFGLENQNLFCLSICFCFGYQELNWLWGCSIIKFTIWIVKGRKNSKRGQCCKSYLLCWILLLYLQQFVTKHAFILLCLSYRTSIGCFFTNIIF